MRFAPHFLLPNIPVSIPLAVNDEEARFELNGHAYCNGGVMVRTFPAETCVGSGDRNISMPFGVTGR